MKIAIFIDSYHIGGVQKVFLTLANEWALMGHNVNLLVLTGEGAFSGSIDPRVTVMDLNCTSLKQSFFKISKVINSLNIDYLLVGKDGVNIFFLLLKVFGLIRTKLIISQHNYLYFENKADTFFYRWFIPRAMKLLYNRADHIICVAEGLKKYLNRIGIKTKKMTVIYNPIDYKGINHLSTFSTELPYDYCIYCGRLSTIKNLDLLLGGFELFLLRNTSYKLILLGDGVESNKVNDFIRKKHLENSIVMMGAVSNPYKYIKGAKALILPSLSEALGMVILEAYALGVTVIATPTGGAKELLSNDRGYLLNSFNDARELSCTIELAIKDPKPSNALIRYSQHFDKAIIAAEYINLFAKL